MKNHHAPRPLLLVATAMLFVLTLLLPSCARLHKVTFADNAYQDTKTGLTYRALSNDYEPISRGDAYATVKIGNLEHTLYRITDLEPGAFLSSVYTDVY